MIRPRFLIGKASVLRFDRLMAAFAVAACAAVLPTAASGATVIQSWSLDTNPGWSMTGEWAFGQPTGQGGGIPGFFPDPTSGHTGTNVYGVNLNGNYSTVVSPPYYLTTGPINCSGWSYVTLKFWRWLNSDYPAWVYDTVEVSSDGLVWTVVWSNPWAVYDGFWTQESYDISSIADNQPTVYIRWGYQVGHYYHDGIWACSGWNIDDVEIVSEPPVDLTMAVDPSGGGTTDPPVGGPYTYIQGSVVYINATPNPGYRFDHWEVSAGAGVQNPTSASTTVAMDVSKTVTAVFVAGPPVDLTMAVSPPGAGTTNPAEGGPYSELLNDVVSLTATPSAGYRFDHWEVSAGWWPADPYSADTTVIMDESKTITAVFVPVELTMGVSPEGAGTTVPAVGGPYPKNLYEVVSIQATPGAGYVFDHWEVSAGWWPADPYSAGTTVTMDESKTVVAVFVPIELTMAVIPPGAGTTVPAVGGPYPKSRDEVVSIQAIANPGCTFHHWTVSAGSGAADPNAASTTVTMDRAKTVTAVFARPEFRGISADVFHWGLQSASLIDDMIGYAVTGGYNAIIAEVLAYHDGSGGSHGAYWRSNIVARTNYVTSSFDPLGYLVERAHASGLEVHAWLVAFRASSSWPPPGNEYLAMHPEWLMVPQASMGTLAPVGKEFVFDPGSPDVQEYLVSIVRELAANYAIDGIHWDYIRYTQTDAGYPSDTSYTNSGLARFQRITGRNDVPPPTDDAQWDDFRRRTIDELMRRCRAEIPLITSNPRQPLRHTASLIPWGDAPADFTDSSAYNLFQDWELWMRNGWLDAGCPMLYYREHCPDQYQSFRNWVDASLVWRYDRHMYLNQGSYMNGMENSITQMRYMYEQGTDGSLNYSYYSTRASETYCYDNNDVPVNDFSWYPYVAGNLFTYTTTTPSMPWRNPATATEGTLYGQVLDAANGSPIDDASVQVGSLDPVQTDGNGYYVVTMIPAAGTGTGCSVTATKGELSNTHHNIVVVAGDVRRNDLMLGVIPPPTITRQPSPQGACPGSTARFTAAATGDGPPTYQWQKDEVDIGDGDHYTGTTSGTLTISNVDATVLGNYRCAATNSGGVTYSNAAALSILGAPVITQQPQPRSVHLHASASFTITATEGGSLTYQWRKNGANLTDGPNIQGARWSTLTIQNVSVADLGNYSCAISGECSGVTSNPAALSLSAAPGDFDGDEDVDMIDLGHLQICLSGATVAQNNPSCQDAKMDGDADIDEADMGVFLRCMSGPGTPANAHCAD